MNDLLFKNVAAYSESRRQDLLEIAEACHQVQSNPEVKPIDGFPLAVRVGDLLITAGTKLKQRYALPTTNMTIQVQRSE